MAMLESSSSSGDVSSMQNKICLVSIGGLEAEMWPVENFPWRVFGACRCVKSVRVATRCSCYVTRRSNGRNFANNAWNFNLKALIKREQHELFDNHSSMTHVENGTLSANLYCFLGVKNACCGCVCFAIV